MFLLDTNVVSEIRKTTFGRANPNVVAWNLEVVPQRTFLSTITLMEI